MEVATIDSRVRILARLDDLLASRFALQSRQARITSAAQLPPVLAFCARNLAPDCGWRAHTTGEEVFFAIARPRRLPPGAALAAAIDVYLLDPGARVYSAGVWEHEALRGWWLDSVLVPSYDTEHGWWLADVVRANRPRRPGSEGHAAQTVEYEASSYTPNRGVRLSRSM